MAERLTKMFSSPKFKENRAYLSNNLCRSVSPLLSSSRYNAVQDDLSLEMDAKSEGFTSRICDTANSLLLGEFPWGSDRQGDSLTIKQNRLPKPVPVRIRIGPPNSSNLMSEGDGSEYENEEYNSSRSLIQALREMSRKRSHSLINEESDSEIDSAAPKKTCRSTEFRHNLYLSQLEEDTQEYKNGTNCNTQQEHLLERPKRGREDDSSPLLANDIQDVTQSKRRRNRLDDCLPVAPCNGTNTSATNRTFLQAGGRNNATNHNSNSNSPRRGSNEIFSSLSSSLTLLDPAVLYRLIRPSISKRPKKQKKVVAVETQTLEASEISVTSPKDKDQGSPKKEDKSINTEPVKKAPIEDKIVTDQMTNSIMKSAVKKFMATEDPALSPVRNPNPKGIAGNEKPSSDSSVIKPDLLLPAVSSPPFLQTSSVSTTCSLTLPPSTNQPTVNTASGNGSFTFGAPISSVPNFTSLSNTTTLTATTTSPNSVIPKQPDVPPLSFSSPSAVVNTTTSTQFSSCGPATTTASSFIFTSPTAVNTNSNIETKPVETTKSFTFGSNKLSANFKPLEPNVLESSKLETNKKIETASLDLFKQPTLAFSANTSTTAAPSTTPTNSNSSSMPELGKGTFSFGNFSTAPSSSSTITTASDTLKSPTFTFGNSSANANNKPVTSSLFGVAAAGDTSKAAIESPKLSLFATSPSSSAIKVAEPSTQQVSSGIVSSGGFQFGAASAEDKKPTEKPNEPKPQGVFAFGNGSSTVTTTAATVTTTGADKSFTFGATANSSTTNKTENIFKTQMVQKSAPNVFLFGNNTFGTTQANKEPFTFGSKPSEQTTTTPSFSTPSTGLFGGKPASSSSSSLANPTPAAAATTTTASLFGFGVAQPPAAATTATPTFGSIASTTNTTMGRFSFPPKTEGKPSTTVSATAASTTGSGGGFPFKFSGGNSSQSVETPKTSFTFSPSSAQQQSTTPAFGSTTSMPTFGSVAPSVAPSFSGFPTTTPTAPSFGASSTMQNPAPAFGSTTPAPTFGAPAAQPAPVFGGIQAQQQQPQAPNFTFGAPSASSTAGGGGFNFGASTTQQPTAAAAPQPSSSGLFQFGSAANQQNPAGSGGPAFQFNAGPSTTPQGFGFTSSLGGFNPGVGSGQPMFSIGSGSTAPRSRQLLRRKK